MSFHIREFRAEDADAVNRVALAAYDQYRLVFSDWPRTAAFFAKTAILAGELDLLVVQDGHDILGCVGYVAPGRPREDIFAPEWAAMRMLAVDPAARGRGIGRKLTEVCIARALRDGAPVIALHTSPLMEIALSMYRRLGFTHYRDIPERHGVPYAVYTLPLQSGG